MQRILLIASPWLKPCAKQKLAKFETELQRRGIEFHYYITTGHWQNDLTAIKHQLYNVTDAIAVGGDGTVNLVINCIAETSCRLGILPAGTGNDYYRTAYGDHRNWLQHLLSDQSVAVDLGQCNERYFINILGVGFDGNVVRQLAQNKRSWLSVLRYPMVVVKTLLANPKAYIELDSEGYQFQGTVVTALFGNGHYFSRGIKVLEHADLSNNQLACQYMPHIPWIRQVWQWLRLLAGKSIPASLKHCWQAQECNITVSGLPVQGDGEYFGVTPVKVRVVANAVALKYASDLVQASSNQ